MGYGLPAAIAAKIAHPERAVVALAGDGCMLMTGQELATAVQYGLAIVLIVANNGMYGTIRMHQERLFPGRVLATSLVNPDFAALARSFGAAGVDHHPDRGLPPGAAARPVCGPPDRHRAEARPRGDQPAADAERDPQARGRR